jgi:hypothetical protein
MCRADLSGPLILWFSEFSELSGSPASLIYPIYPVYLKRIIGQAQKT